MKQTQSSALICEVCRQGVRSHHGPGAGMYEAIRQPDGSVKKFWYHVNRCWPKERRRRKKEQRRAEMLRLKEEVKTMDEPTQTPEPPTQSVAKIGGGPKRGLGTKVYEILDSIPLGQEWCSPTIAEKLKVHGLETTPATIQQIIYTYKTDRRAPTLVRRQVVNGRGALKIYRFDTPPPAEPTPPRAHGSRSPRSLRKEQPVARIGQAPALPSVERIEEAKAELLTAPAPPPRPAPKPAPTPGLSNADLNRAFNDFQAFILEALMDFRNDLLKKLR